MDARQYSAGLLLDQRPRSIIIPDFIESLVILDLAIAHSHENLDCIFVCKTVFLGTLGIPSSD